MKKVILGILIFGCVVFVLFLFIIGARKEGGRLVINKNLISSWIYDHTRKIVVTEANNPQWLKAAFAQHVKILVLREGRVWIESDGFLTIRTASGELSTIFSVSQAEEFFGRPDHHAWMKFKILKLEPDG